MTIVGPRMTVAGLGEMGAGPAAPPTTPGARTEPLESPRATRYRPAMPDDLYDRDVLLWSQHQADLLRRLARGERVNDIDWLHVVEEIEDVGLSELNAVRSYLRLMLVHLLKLRGWPDSPAAGHWRTEVVSFQKDAARRFAPSMRQRLDIQEAWADARDQLEDAIYDGQAAPTWPATCPFTLDDLLTRRRADLEDQVNAAA